MVNTNETSPEEITQMMVGRHVELGGHKEKTEYTEQLLELKNINYTYNNQHILKDISLSIKRGEILGIAGIDGSGQKELTEIVAGVISPESGQVIYRSQDITLQQVKERKDQGIGFIPQDRHLHGLVLNFSIEENLIMGFQRNEAFIKKNKILLNSDNINMNSIEKINDYDIRTPSEKSSCC